MTKDVEAFFKKIENNSRLQLYEEYFDSIAPQNAQDIFWRFVFAFTSIHSTYKTNIRAYQALRNPESWKSSEALYAALTKARCGMQNQRTKFLWKFAKDFFFGEFSSLQFTKNLQHQRNVLTKRLLGIGMAKISFALEMSFPRQNEVVCFDVHQLRLYGKPQKINLKDYEECEKDWCQRCLQIGFSPFVVRNLYWDILKKKKSPRFWSYVFEPGLETLDISEAENLDFPTQDTTINEINNHANKPKSSSVQQRSVLQLDACTSASTAN